MMNIEQLLLLWRREEVERKGAGRRRRSAHAQRKNKTRRREGTRLTRWNNSQRKKEGEEAEDGGKR
jgi:hypothetical protein